MKQLIIGIVLLFLSSVVGIGAAWYFLNKAINAPQASLPETLLIESGTTAFRLFDQMVANDQLALDPTWFRVWARLHPEKLAIKTGYYTVDPNMSAYTLLERLTAGETKQFSVTLIEGLRIQDWFNQLQTIDSLQQDVEDFSQLYNQVISEQSFCLNDYESLEGCLLPDTYAYEYQDSVLDVFKRAYSAMQTYLNDQWQNRFFDVPLKSAYEGLILASIIEKETAVSSERDIIAGVFVNRLDKGMRLQTDPTVIYGLGDSFDGNITRKHLRTPTPYNTYTISGLPITPIAMPSRASVNAALRPALTDYFYFVSKGDGSHQFSENLSDHNKAVRKYQLGIEE